MLAKMLRLVSPASTVSGRRCVFFIDNSERGTSPGAAMSSASRAAVAAAASRPADIVLTLTLLGDIIQSSDAITGGSRLEIGGGGGGGHWAARGRSPGSQSC